VKHAAKIMLDKAYFGESYDLACAYASKRWMLRRLFGVMIIAASIGTFFYLGQISALPLVLALIGAYEVLAQPINKFFWLRNVLKSKVANSEVEFAFDEHGIQSNSKYMDARVKWSGIERHVMTPKGILIWPHKSAYFYVPVSAAGDDGIAFIRSQLASF
jgi:hypothetical protein